MRHLIIIGLSAFLSSSSLALCPGGPQTNGSLQWSKPARIVAPNRHWVVQVHPILDADENQTPVTLRKCEGSQSWPLFTLQRSAELYWAPDSRHVLVVDAPLSGTNKLLLFSVPTSFRAQGTPDALERTVKVKLREQLGENRHIQFYLPKLVSWSSNGLMLAIGGQTYVGNGGPLDNYCYGLRINNETLRVDNVLSEGELRAMTGHGCQVSP